MADCKGMTGETAEGGSMGNYMRISSGNMRKDMEGLQNEADQIPNAINELVDAMNVLSSCWEGPAKSAYLAQVQTDISFMKEVCDLLQKYINDFRTSAGDYDQCENKVYDRLGQIHIW